MFDADGASSDKIKLDFDRSEGRMTLTADEDWLGNAERVYPVRIDPGPFVLTPSEFIYANVASGEPGKFFGDNGNSYVGHHDTLKNCRVFMALGMNLATIMGQTGIVSAQLSVSSQTNNGDGTTAICAYAPSVPWNATTLTWNSMPTEAEMGPSLGMQIVEAPGYRLVYDVTQVVESWVGSKSTQAGFALVAQVEPSPGHEGEGLEYKYENLYNKASSTDGPRLDVSWEGELTEFDKLDINGLTAEVSAVIEKTGVNGRNVLAVVAHGISQTDSTVSYAVVDEDEETDDPSDDSVTATGSAQYPN